MFFSFSVLRYWNQVEWYNGLFNSEPSPAQMQQFAEFTRIIWKVSRRIYCSVSFSESGSEKTIVVVARYHEVSNQNGKYSENVCNLISNGTENSRPTPNTPQGITRKTFSNINERLEIKTLHFNNQYAMRI